MIRQEKEKLYEFTKNIIVHVFRHYGEAVLIDINWRKKVGSIGAYKATLGGKKLINNFQWGSAFRKTIHNTIPQLQDRHPNGYEALYWIALNTAAAIYSVNHGKYGRSRIYVKPQANEMHKLSIAFSFDEMMRLYFDAATAVAVQTVIDIPEQKPKSKEWGISDWEAVQNYIEAIVYYLAERYGLAEKTAVEFKNTNQAFHKQGYQGIPHYIRFGKKRIVKYFYWLEPEWKRVKKQFGRFQQRKIRGIEALYWIACHEFAHALQTEIEMIDGAEYGPGGKRIVHGDLFVRELRRVVDDFTFQDSLNLILPETEEQIRSL